MMESNSEKGLTREKIKELFKRPGGTFAKVTGILALCGIGYGIFKALPFLIAGTTNLIIFIAELVALALLVYVVTSKEFRRGIQLGWLQLTRKIYGLIVNIDPIAILENGIEEMKERSKTVAESVTKLESLLVGMKRKLKEYESDFEKDASRKKQLEEMLHEKTGNDLTTVKGRLQVVNNNIARASSQMKAQQERITTSEKYLKIMKRLEEIVGLKVEDAENELRFRKDEYEQAKAQSKAMKSITSIFDGDLSRTLEQELAMANVTDTVNNSIAEMNRLLDGSNDLLLNYEMDSNMNADKADAILAQFYAQGFDIFNAEKSSQENRTSKYIEAGEAEYVEVSAVKQSKYF